jgi:SAM-dependent methyltransferase
MRDPELLAWLASLPPDARDEALDARLGTAPPLPAFTRAPPGEHLIGYYASAVAPIVRALLDVPVVRDDVVVDLGAGLGKVVFLAQLLTGAAARGVELQPALVQRASEAAARLGVDVTFAQEDARNASLDDGTVFFLYLPFTGPALAQVMERVRAVASRRAIVVCGLGIELDRAAPWLTRRPTDSFWLTVYDGAAPGVAPRPARASPLRRDQAEAVANGRTFT